MGWIVAAVVGQPEIARQLAFSGPPTCSRPASPVPIKLSRSILRDDQVRAAELVVQAHARNVVGKFRIEYDGRTRVSSDQCGTTTGVAKVQVKIFKLDRPVAAERRLHAR